MQEKTSFETLFRFAEKCGMLTEKENAAAERRYLVYIF